METADRIALAKKKVDRLLDTTLSVMRQRASNEIVLYSGSVSKQVGRSYAAHAFDSLQRTMFERELVTLCAVWDDATNNRQMRERDSIPAFLRLVDDEKVVTALVAQTYATFLNMGVRSINAAEDHETRKLLEEMHAQHNLKMAEEQATRARKHLAEAVALGTQTLNGELLKGVKHYRDHKIAHVLSRELEEARAPERLARYGDEKKLFETTQKVVDWLLLGVSGVSFAWDNSFKYEKRYAEAFWNGVTIRVLE